MSRFSGTLNSGLRFSMSSVDGVVIVTTSVVMLLLEQLSLQDLSLRLCSFLAEVSFLRSVRDLAEGLVFAVFPHISSAAKHWFSCKVLGLQDEMALLTDCILKRGLTPC
jgi:hypothetical protein